jgi:hypothetical protein
MYQSEAQLERAFLESGRQRATLWHASNDVDKDWNTYEVLTPEMMAEAYHLRKSGDEQMVLLGELIEAEPGLIDAFFATAITEDGITYYPLGVGRTFNPEGNAPDDNDPHNLFSRRWSAQEYQHGLAEARAMEALGLDMSGFERLRKMFVSTGIVPVVNSSFDGVAYTAPQESLTSTPYQNMIRAMRTFYDKGLDAKSHAGLILEAIINNYREIAQEERLHRRFISDSAEDGLHSGDSEVSGRMMKAIADRFLPKGFPMPGIEMPGFEERARSMGRARIFAPRDVKIAKARLLKKWRISEVSVINAEGYQAQQKLGELLVRYSALLTPS